MTKANRLVMPDVTLNGIMPAQGIFKRYAKDVEEVQQHYEKGKRAPKLPRMAPPVAGHILWARQLLRRIELPMDE